MGQRLFICTALLLGLQAQAFAQSTDHAERYDQCMELVVQNPTKAFDEGVAWQALGGGDAAEHCIATSMIGMGMYAPGADRLEKLADHVRETKEFKAAVLAQSAQAWFLAREYNRAHLVINTAIGLDETQSEFFVDRAQILAAQSFLNEALEDLNQALTLDDMNIDALVFRGTLYRQVENFEQAWSDISKAVDLMPAHQEGLLERGMLYRIEGKDDKARQDWLEVIDINPRNETAKAARLNLEKMDVKVQ